MTEVSATFSGSVPEYYDRCLGVAWFDAFAADLAARLPARPPGDVLELACGTGLVTQHLRDRLDDKVRLVATDLSKAMLDYARGRRGGGKVIEWREADATNLPFSDGEFGAVVCGFGFMFVPDKEKAFREARRVLTRGGILLFSVWDRIEMNPHHLACAEVLEGLFPGDEEMRFRFPYEMYDPALLQRLVTQAGFAHPALETKRFDVATVSARTIATGQIRGTPRSLLIEKRGVALDDVIEKVMAALAKRGGADPYRGPVQAVVAEARAL
jgi:ubiquinone/menaquinone biosynthesis C-methylase UbiE